jgi:hypothetical protein
VVALIFVKDVGGLGSVVTDDVGDAAETPVLFEEFNEKE